MMKKTFNDLHYINYTKDFILLFKITIIELRANFELLPGGWRKLDYEEFHNLYFSS
jgi:hypothetical protein